MVDLRCYRTALVVSSLINEYDFHKRKKEDTKRIIKFLIRRRTDNAMAKHVKWTKRKATVYIHRKQKSEQHKQGVIVDGTEGHNEHIMTPAMMSM